MKHPFLLAAALAILTLGRAEPAWARNTLLDATDEIVDDVKKFLDSEGKNKIRIGQFIGKGVEALRASSSPLLREALRSSLRKKEIDLVDAGAHYELTGSFQAIEDTVTGRQAVIFNVVLDDLKGNERRFQGTAAGKAEKYYFDNLPDVGKVLGPNVYLPPNVTQKEKDEIVKDAVDHPQCPLDGTRILAGKGAPFAIELLVAPPSEAKHKPEDYKVRRPQDRKGLAFVPIQRSEAYGVRLINDADFEVAVDLRLDGISMYHFGTDEKKKAERAKQGKPPYSYVVLAPKSSIVIRGWFVTLNDSDEFLVVPREKSVFAELNAGNPAEVGTVTALFHRAWDKKEKRPADEPATPDQHSLSSDATGRGQRFDEKYLVVDYAVGTLRGAVSARYTK